MTKPAKKKWGKARKSLIIASTILAIAALIVLAVVFGDELFELFHKTDEVKEVIKSAGIFGPILFVLLQIVQVVIAPIPGQVVGIAGGYIFGWWGLLLSIVGSSIGYYIVFKIARRWGRPLAERLFKKESIKKFDYITESKGAFILFLIFLLPFFPDDMICYLAGLTKVPVKHLMVAAVSGRVPGFLIATLAGSGLEANNMKLIIATVVGSLLILGICYWQRAWLDRLAKSHNHLKFIKENWALNVWQTAAVIVALVIALAGIVVFTIIDF